MEPEGSLLSLQESATDPCPESHEVVTKNPTNYESLCNIS